MPKYDVLADKVLCGEEVIPVAWSGDVLVCGGGPGGLGAAITANRLGLKVMLVEELGFLGGMCSYGEGMPMGYVVGGISNGGIAEQLIQKVENAGQDSGKKRGTAFHYSAEYFKCMIAALVREEGLPLRLHTMAGDVIMEGKSRVAGVITQSKSGRQAFLAKTVIDATGDGDLAARAGCPFMKGRPEDGALMAVTLVFTAGNVDIPAFQAYKATDPYLAEAIKKAAACGEEPDSDEQVFYLTPGIHPHTLHCNTVHIRNVDGTNAEDLTNAELESYIRIQRLIKFFRNHVPGCENCYASSIGARLGVRDSRRIEGEEMLTLEDKRTFHKSKNVILRNAGPLDDALRGNDSPNPDVGKLHNDPHDWFDIPYGVIVPKGVDNLVVAGRSFSADHLVHSGSRGIGLMMNLGQAAANAAMLAIRDNKAFRDIPVQELQRLLVSQGAYLGENAK